MTFSIIFIINSSHLCKINCLLNYWQFILLFICALWLKLWCCQMHILNLLFILQGVSAQFCTFRVHQLYSNQLHSWFSVCSSNKSAQEKQTRIVIIIMTFDLQIVCYSFHFLQRTSSCQPSLKYASISTNMSKYDRLPTFHVKRWFARLHQSIIAVSTLQVK